MYQNCYFQLNIVRFKQQSVFDDKIVLLKRSLFLSFWSPYFEFQFWNAALEHFSLLALMDGNQQYWQLRSKQKYWAHFLSCNKRYRETLSPMWVDALIMPWEVENVLFMLRTVGLKKSDRFLHNLSKSTKNWSRTVHFFFQFYIFYNRISSELLLALVIVV